MITERITSLKRTVSNTNVILKAYCWKLRHFKPKVSFCLETKKFLVETVENGYGLEKALNLRHEVFYEELLNKRGFIGVDLDNFDSICDHLVVVDKQSEEVVGTYRLISSTFSDRFYSETEFGIESIRKAPGNKLELGRACVHRGYRNGVTLALLWKGILEYARAVEARYLFGLSSINTTNLAEIGLAYKYLRDLHFSSEEFRVYPKDRYVVRQLNDYLDTFERLSVNAEMLDGFIPPLLRGYLRAGARVCGEPALDRKFRCADFLTMLDVELLNRSFERYRVKND